MEGISSRAAEGGSRDAVDSGGRDAVDVGDATEDGGGGGFEWCGTAAMC